MKKSALREKYKAMRLELSKEKLGKLNSELYEEFVADFSADIESVHLFLPITKWNEPDTFLLLPFLWKQNVKIYTSITDTQNKKMVNVRIGKQTKFIPDPWGIPVPDPIEQTKKINPDIILVPFLYCDQNGNRVGYGKGFYDHFLGDYPESIKCGYGFFEPLETIEDLNEFDVPLDKVYLPGKTIEFER